GSSLTMKGANITLYARWVPANKYQVKYYANGATGGSVPTDNSLYAFNARAKVLGPGTLVKSGYEFSGWNTKADGTGMRYNPGDEITISRMDATLYAQWKQTVALKPQTGWIDFSDVPPNTDIYLDGGYLRSTSVYRTSNFQVVPVGNHKVELVYKYSPGLQSAFYEVLEVSAGNFSKPVKSLGQLADYLEEKKKDAEEYQSKSKSRSTKVFFSLAGLGAAGICYLTGQAAYANYQSASDPADIAAYRSQAELFSGATIASLALGALFTIQLPAIKVPPKPDTNGMSLDDYIKDLDLTITRIRSNL
ncbi:MAG: InlB B-repeat-containing protein, partial [Rectinema subterraneum]|uniref:InlB B-repeat-containing protein n=1 Tax=Rectinema subterraneum TaxID=2653714 RepID=UPI003C7A2F5B